MTPKAWLFLALAAFVAYYVWSWVRGVRAEGGGSSASAGGGVIAGVILGAICGWIAGGGITPLTFALVSPFSGAGANSAMWISIASISMIGAMVPLLISRGRTGMPNALEIGIGLVTNFFDTLGIGSFAPTTAAFKAKGVVDDRLIPGTLNVGHTPPTIAQAFIFITIVEVDFTTLIVLLLGAVLGSWLGAGLVAGWSKQRVQVGMGVTLLAASLLFFARNIDGMRETPFLTPGTAIALTGPMLALGFAGNFFLGALMTLGVGLYGPCLIMISLLGMNPTTAFPIMMGSCAFLMPVASARFVKEKSYALRPAIGLSLAGIPAVLLAAIILGSLPGKVVAWIVPTVVMIAALIMLRAWRISMRQPQAAAA
jgi:uncharacterized membrane protein YfcA